MYLLYNIQYLLFYGHGYKFTKSTILKIIIFGAAKLGTYLPFQSESPGCLIAKLVITTSLQEL